MSWFADLAGKAENLLNNIDEQTGAALRNHNVAKSKKHDYVFHQDPPSPGQRKRQAQRNQKRVSTATETRSSMIPSRKPSPMTSPSRSPSKDSHENVVKSPRRKSPSRKPNAQFSLNHSPNTLVGDLRYSDVDDQFGLKQRRFSLPADLELLNSNNLTYKMQNLEVENAMLKNELNVMNHEVSELLDRLRRTEDGNVLVNGVDEELSKTQIKFESAELQYQRLGLEKDAQNNQLETLKAKIMELTNVEVVRHKEQSLALETENSLLKDRNQELEDKIKQLTDKTAEHNTAQIKMENDLRHAQSVIGELQADLEKSTAECRRLERDWETYKLRVKSMLHAKDDEIKVLQEGMNLGEETKALVEQIDALKDERETLTESIGRVRSECDSLRQHSEQLEARRVAAERVVAALRDALKEERAARNRAEGHCLAMGKELKTLQIETGQTIASLRTALQDKESEVNNLRCTASSARSVSTGALNVADYDVMQEQVDNEKIRHLTETLVQRQNRVDSLLRDNNSLKIQLEKLESKYKAEVSSKRHHAVVTLEERGRRAHAPALASLSARLALAMTRHPLFRTFLVIYMVCLHLWVMTVLFTSTPDGHAARQVKS